MDELVIATREKVRGYLREIYDTDVQEIDDRFVVREGSAIVQVVVRGWHKEDTAVECFAYVVQDAKITPELMSFLLRKNASLHFGAFSLIFDDTIMFSHAIAGSNMNMNEFRASVHTVARIADYFDEEIVRMAGGKKALEVVTL